MRRFAISMVARGCCSLLIFGGVLWLTGSTATAFIGQFVVWTTVLVIHDFPIARRLADDPKSPVHWAALVATFRSSWQLGLAQFIASLQTAVPRFVIDRVLGLEAVGLFTALAYLLQASNMTMTAVTRSFMGQLANLAHENDGKSFRSIIRRYGIISCLVGSVLLPLVWAFGDDILTLMFGEGFQGQTVLVILMFLAALCRALGILFQSAPLSYRRFDLLVRIRLLDLLLVTLFSVIGVLVAGLNGVAAGLAVTSVILLCVLFYLFLALSKTRPGPKEP
jgi:O-antigen/teichoic acid export membrane protein